MTSRSCSRHGRHWAAGVLLALLVLTAVAAAPLAHAGVRLPDGQWFEQTDDLRVKVMGGHVAVSRTWLNNRWYFNPAWARLAFKYDSLGQISTIDRAGWSYHAHGPGLWAFDSKNSIVASASGYRWQDRRGNSVDYDASGRILAYADRNSVKVSFIQDQANRITGVFDHFGHQVLWFEYGIAADQVLALQVTGGADVSLPSAIRDASGRRVEYRYTSGRLTSVIDVFGNAWNYGYDTAGRLVSVGDPENRSTSVAYAANGRVSAVTHADATVTAYGYDYDSAKRQLYVQLRHPDGRPEQMWYGLDGVLRRHEIAGQPRMQLAVDGRTLARTAGNGATTREELDEWGNLVKRIHPDGGVELFEREPRFSEVTRYVDENGNETRYEYDARGNLARRVEAAGTPQARTSEYSYDQYGNRVLARRLGDSVTVEANYGYEYDQAGNLVAVTEPEGNVSRYGYDAQGNLLSFSDGRDRTWTFTYDAAGRLLAETDPLGQSERYSLDRVGNVVAYTDRRGQTWRFDYDPRDRPTARTDPLGNIARTQYDPEGFPIRLTDEEGRSQDLAYDPLKRLSSARDGRGNVVELRYPAGGRQRDLQLRPEQHRLSHFRAGVPLRRSQPSNRALRYPRRRGAADSLSIRRGRQPHRHHQCGEPSRPTTSTMR